MSQPEVALDDAPLVRTRTRSRSRSRRALAASAVVALLGVVAACGNDDDGADVRSEGPGTSGSGSGSASGTGSETGSGSEVAGECEVVDGTAGVADADTVVDVTLSEYTVIAEPAEVPAGAIGFRAENAGGEDHELVIAKVASDDIEVVDGAPDEEALGDALIGEIEAFPSGETCDGTFELDAGEYTLFCAIVETDGMGHSHFEEGMVTTFTVT